MKATEFIRKLTAGVEKYGDLEVVSDDQISGAEPISAIEVDNSIDETGKPVKYFYVCDRSRKENCCKNVILYRRSDLW